ncbi:ESPR-type extended signal peptide-containing protein, partial [Amantichitinum ursilacus]
MNQRRYRLVFNRTRGLLMAVAETTVGQRQSASGST